MSTDPDTVPTGEDPAPGAPPRVPWLVLLVQAERPTAPSQRHLLTEVDDVRLGRGEAGYERRERSLSLRFDDARASTRHAVVVRTGGGWELEDLGSRNGTFLDGKRVSRARLRDGALIEIGHTFLLFRDQAARLPPGEPLDGDAPGGELATLSLPLAQRFREVTLVARSAEPILLQGETGTGKEVAARAVHRLSGRGGSLVPVNCGALPDNLVES